MNILVRLADRAVDNFTDTKVRDWSRDGRYVFETHSYRVEIDESLKITKATKSARWHPTNEELHDWQDEGAVSVALYRPNQWTSVREA